jgi:hypothetical protein
MANKSKNNRLLKRFSYCCRAASDRATDRTISSFMDIYSNSSGQQPSWLGSIAGREAAFAQPWGVLNP